MLLGLTVSESAKLCNYMHFRDPIRLGEKSLLQKANLDKAIDFIDPVDEDIPKGLTQVYQCKTKSTAALQVRTS